MPSSFDNTLLDINYSALADGGAEFATAIVRSGAGGLIAQRNVNREDFISRYEIEYTELSPTRRRELRSFAIARRGMARAFRFLPPDDFEFVSEIVGRRNAITGEIEPAFTTNGSDSRFFTIRYYAGGDDYTRWIVKPSPLDEARISIVLASTGNEVESAIIPGGLVGGSLPDRRVVVLGNPFGALTLYYNLGILQFLAPPPAGYIIKFSGTYHLPVTFTDDLQKFQVDFVGISEFKVNLEEILPVELGLTPDMALPPSTDTEPPTVPGNFTATVISSSQINLNWNPSSDNVAVAGYEVEIS